MSAKSKLIKIVVPILIIIAGIVVAKLLIAQRPEPKKTARENPGALVETLPVTRGQRQVQVHATGTVQARRRWRSRRRSAAGWWRCRRTW